MKLFDRFEAVKFSQENLIFITDNEYLYYIYNPKYKHWQKYKNCGNDRITVSNYDDVSKEELVDAMNGIFPQAATDFMRLCHPSDLYVRDMLDLLEDDYPDYMSDNSTYRSVRCFLCESTVYYKSFLELKKLFDNARLNKNDNLQILEEIKELSFKITGRDIFKPEIGIIDGHDCSSYFWIMPVRVIDYSDTNAIDNVAKMKSAEISIEEDDVSQYLAPFLYKHYDNELKANKKRIDYDFDDDYNHVQSTITGFQWYLTHNFFTFESIYEILKDIKNTIDALILGTENEFTKKLPNTPPQLIIDFYHRFIYRMEYMIKIGKEKGYDLISFMGP